MGVSDRLGVERFVMDNGLTVLYARRENLPIVKVSVLVKAGSYDEPERLAGLATLTASLLTEGAGGRTSAEMADAVEFIGASLGASASRDYTSVDLSVLGHDVRTGFTLLSDVLMRPAFDQAEIERKVQRMQGSLRQQEVEPNFLASRAFRARVFAPGHPYARVSAGTVESLGAITREDVLGFYRAHYVPSNAIISVVGEIGREELDALLVEFMGSWDGGEAPARAEYGVRVPEPGVVVIDRDLTQATILLGHEGVARENPDYYALSVMNYVLGGGGFSSRLMETVRDRMGLAYGIYSSYQAEKFGGMFYVSVQTKNESAGVVVEEVLRQARAMIEAGVTDTELSDAKAYLTGSFPRRLDTMGKIAGFLTQVEFHGLGLDYPENYVAYINAVTPEEIRRVARTYLHPDRCVIVVVGREDGLVLPVQE
jgi:zinc protease